MVAESRFIEQYIGQLKDKLDELAHGSMNAPLRDPYDHGVVVGHYRGLQEALQLLEAQFEEEDKKEI